jgi:predicted transcriptional regulator
VANIEDLKEQLEALKIVNEAAYKETVRAIIEQRKLEAQLKAGAIAAEDYKKKTEELNNSLSDEAKEMKALQEEIHKTTEAMEKLKAVSDKANETLTGAASAVDSFTGLNMKMFTSFRDTAGGAFDYSRKIQGLSVEIRRSTGFANRHVKSFDDIRASYASVGIDAAGAAQAITSLSTGFSAFDGVTESTRKSLLTTAKDFNTLGVEFDDFASMNERLRFSFGLVGGAAQAASEDMKRISLETGRALPQVVKDFNEIGPALARFGSDGPRIFEALAKKARVLGTTIKEAFDITELFDTFEGAANVAGRLNAQLGLQLNSVEMMKATSEERLDILRQEFSMRGIDIQTAGRRQQQMIASILGTDVETAKKMLGPEMDANRFRAEATTQEQRIKQEDLANSTREKQIEAIVENTVGLRNLISVQNKALRFANDNAGATAGGTLATSGVIAGIASIGTLALTRGRGAALMARMRGTAPRTAPSGPAPRTQPTAGNRQQRRAREAIERRQGRRGSLPRPAPASGAAKGLAMGGAKALGRAIPFLGMGIGIMGAMNRIGSGDYMGALGELGVGALSFIPGLGGLAAAGLGSVALSRRDSNRASSQMNAQSASFQKDMRENRANELVIKELVVQSTVELDGTKLGETIKTYLGKNAKIVGGAMNNQLQPTSGN